MRVVEAVEGGASRREAAVLFGVRPSMGGDLDAALALAFPNGDGGIDWHANIINRGLIPAQIAAGVSTIKQDADGNVITNETGEPVYAAKYTGLHALRHFYASWCINRKIDGGLELPAKVVQERLGHSSIAVTLDTYGHLFPRGDDGGELAEAERALLGPDAT
jgi:integrase